MYIDDWDSFYVQAEELWRQQPLKTRYCIKYRHTEGKLVLKVTDDVVCLKYKTDQLVDVKRMEKLNSLMFLLMSRGPNASMDDEAPEQQQHQQQQPQQQQQQAVAAAAGGGGGGGSKARGKGAGGRRKG
ncbi:hypothetical protein Rsub_01738 [Raphidocelis subcapitata]|uniref:Signal recognition particle 9 kDa protein n=1 Tax=Raphidocelis subcapitata TaxID=307507 RepID=A0A2V0NV64_9CHLO|nr:hypothetical protein Rsub_01738 [Raphidocelis subcapitata]|eukprot:GBF88837.1 hypothetical protein Rsub_01738 [Raphidocelis subcapitata]